VLPALLRDRRLSGRDAAFATELSYGTLRGQGSYDRIIDACVQREPQPEVRDVLRLGPISCWHAHPAARRGLRLGRAVPGHRR